MLEFDLLIFSFGQLPLALMTWVPMFLSTLLVPYQVLRLGARPRAGGAWVLRAGLGCVLLVAHTVGLCALPVLVALKYQLPPASRCILVFEQVTRRGVAGRPRGRGALGVGVLCRLQGNARLALRGAAGVGWPEAPPWPRRCAFALGSSQQLPVRL